MKIHEYQAKEIFARFNIPIPKGEVTDSPEEARQAAKNKLTLRFDYRVLLFGTFLKDLMEVSDG